MGKKILPDDPPGPHGLGDPYSTKLRTVEVEVLVPKEVRERAKKEKCFKEVEDFKDCCKQNQWLQFMNCRQASKAMFECVDRWSRDEEFKTDCLRSYLEKRKEFRLTGKTEKMRRM